MEALMYGVIPIAKMVNFRKAPPENVSNSPVDARHRDVETHHEHPEHDEDKLNALSQLRHRERGQQ